MEKNGIAPSAKPIRWPGISINTKVGVKNFFDRTPRFPGWSAEFIEKYSWGFEAPWTDLDREVKQNGG
jgi:hypothetical protein